VDNATSNVDRGTKEGATRPCGLSGPPEIKTSPAKPCAPTCRPTLHLLNLIVIVNPSKHNHLFLHSNVLFTD
jgi:hypothetical protein